jgi:hypothetical protein
MSRAAFITDNLVVIVFVVIGRLNHHHGESLGGVANTWWPFAAGLLIAWAVVLRAGGRFGPMRTGVMVSLITVAIGMALRVVSGQGTAAAFIVVAVVFLATLMVGTRIALGRLNSR